MSIRARVVVAGLAAVVSLGVAQAAQAQGLGDVAARQKQKRHTAAPPRVFTDDDLQAAAARAGDPPGAAASGEAAAAGGAEAGGTNAPPATREPAAAGAAAPATGAAAPGSEAQPDPLEQERQQRILLEAEWRTRFADARQRLLVADAESWRDVYRDDLINGVAVRIRTREQVETKDLASARQALADLEEEFRRTGLPAGWAREPE